MRGVSGVVEKSRFYGLFKKRSYARRAKNRTERRIVTYIERCGLKRNATDYSALQGTGVL